MARSTSDYDTRRNAEAASDAAVLADHMSGCDHTVKQAAAAIGLSPERGRMVWRKIKAGLGMQAI
jgi:hypothetical protein